MQNVRKGSLEDQFKCNSNWIYLIFNCALVCFSLYAKEPHVDRARFHIIVDIFTRLHTRVTQDEETRRKYVGAFVRLVFEKLKKGPDELLTFDEVEREILQVLDS